MWQIRGGKKSTHHGSPYENISQTIKLLSVNRFRLTRKKQNPTLAGNEEPLLYTLFFLYLIVLTLSYFHALERYTT